MRESGEAYGPRRTRRAGRTLGASATRGAAWFLWRLWQLYRFLLEFSMLLLVAARLLWWSARTARASGTSWVRTASALKVIAGPFVRIPCLNAGVLSLCFCLVLCSCNKLNPVFSRGKPASKDESVWLFFLYYYEISIPATKYSSNKLKGLRMLCVNS